MEIWGIIILLIDTIFYKKIMKIININNDIIDRFNITDEIKKSKEYKIFMIKEIISRTIIAIFAIFLIFRELFL